MHIFRQCLQIPKSAMVKDKLDKLLASMDDADYGRTVTDPTTGAEVKLTDEEVDLIKRIQVQCMHSGAAY